MNHARLFPILLLFLCTQANAQSNCVDALERAQKNYDIGLFGNVITGLENCMPEIKDFKSKLEAHKLLAYTYLAMDSVNQASGEISTLVTMKPDYESQLDAPLLFTLALDDIKQRIAGQITSSVSKKAEKIELAPATIEIITAEEIYRRGYRSLEELFHDVSGFDITSTKGEQYTLLYQRGYRSDLGDRTLVLINGVEDNGLFTNEAHITRQYPLSNIERVEIIYGPATTMYGANAFQGVINIVSKNADQIIEKGKSIGAHVQTGIGTWNTQYYDATLAAKHKKVSVTLTGRVFTSNEMDLSSEPDFDFQAGQGAAGFAYADYKEALQIVVPSPDATDQKSIDDRKLIDSLAGLDPNGDLHFIENGSVYPTRKAFRTARALDSSAYVNPVVKELDENGNVNNTPVELGYSNPSLNKYLAGRIQMDKLTLGFQLWQKEEGQGGLVTDRFFGYGSMRGAELTHWQVRQLTAYSKYDTRVSQRLFLSNYTTFKNFTHYPSLRQTIFSGYISGIKNYLDLVDNEAPSWSVGYGYAKSQQFKNELKALLFVNQNLDIVSGFEMRFGAIPQKMIEMDLSEALLPANINAQLGSTIPGGNVVYSNEFGLYSQGSYRFSDDLKASVGLRADYNSAREEEFRLGFGRETDGLGYGLQINPRVALVYNPEQFIFKAIYASAFLNPSNFQRFGSSAGRVQSAELQIEQVRNLDLAGRYTWKEHSYVELIAFGASYTYAVQTIKGPLGLRFNEVSDLTIGGLSINAKHRFQSGGAYANFTTTHPYGTLSGFNDSGENEARRVGDIASVQINAGAYTYLFKNAITLDVRANRVGKRLTGRETTVINNTEDFIPAYTLLDASLTLNGKALARNDQQALQGLKLQLVVNNLLNETYYHPGARAADGLILTSRILQESRHVFVKLQYQF